jgi:hypothetical protein
VLLRAWSRPDGCLHEVVARPEAAGVAYSRTTVLRLEPALVVSNRTGYELRLLQPQAMQPGAGGGGSGAGAACARLQACWAAGGQPRLVAGGCAP